MDSQFNFFSSRPRSFYNDSITKFTHFIPPVKVDILGIRTLVQFV
jgi:hypothetical protein